MKLYIDLDANRLITDPNFKASSTGIEVKRGDECNIDIQFVSGTTAMSAVSSTKLLFGVKENGKYDSTYLTATSGYSIVNQSYRLTPNFATSAINALLFVDSLSTNDIASVTTMGEFTWSTDGGTNWTSTQTFGVVINNDVNRNNGYAPETAPDPIAWLNSQRPLPVISQAGVPGSSFIDTVSAYLSGGYVETLYQYSSDGWSSDGNGSPPGSGFWRALIRDFLTNSWNLVKYNNGGQIENYTANFTGTQINSFTPDPSKETFPANYSFTTTFSPGISGAFGQMFVYFDTSTGTGNVFVNIEQNSPLSFWSQLN